MLSTKVIIAVEILLSLEPPERDIREYKSPTGTDISGLVCEYRRACKMVLPRLMETGYIVRTNATYRFALMKDPEQITLLHLVRLFHGDLCIGELVDHPLTVGREKLRTPSGCKLYVWETAQRARWRERLRRPITDFDKSIANRLLPGTAAKRIEDERTKGSGSEKECRTSLRRREIT